MATLNNRRLIDITVGELVEYLDTRYIDKEIKASNQITFLKVKECARLTGYAEEYIRQLIFKKKIPHHKVNNGSIRFLAEEVINWMQEIKKLPTDVLAQRFIENNPISIKSRH